MKVTTYQLIPGLHQGPVPPSQEAVIARGFSVLALCAREIQPPVTPDERLTLLRCPLDDNPSIALSDDDWGLAVATATTVTRKVREGRCALVTCAMGLNRSGLVDAIALHMLTGMSGNDAIRHIRQRRGMMALGNPQFVRRLSRLPDRRGRQIRSG